MTCSLISEPSLTWRPLDGADRPLPLSRCRGPIQRWRPTQRAGREDECFKWKYESKKEVKEEVEEEEEENDIRISKRRKEQTTHTHTKKKMGSLWKWSAPEDSVSPWNEEKLWKKKFKKKKIFFLYFFSVFLFLAEGETDEGKYQNDTKHFVGLSSSSSSSGAAASICLFFPPVETAPPPPYFIHFFTDSSTGNRLNPSN